MKNLFAIVLMLLAAPLSTFGSTTTSATETLETHSQVMSSTATLEEDTSTLTVEFIKNSTWDRLLSQDNFIKTEEDKYLNWLIEHIQKPLFTPVYSQQYISFSIGGIRLEDIDTIRFCEKVHQVVALYNSSNSLQLKTNVEFYENSLSIECKSSNLDYLENPVTATKKTAHVRADTVYWESSENFGSGKSGMISGGSLVTVNGVSYLDDNGNILSSYYDVPTEIDIWEKRMLHISLNGINLGWVDPTYLTEVVEGE